ncbi:MAG TPA: outer membrane beta-barrel protein, partial [Puia sp.]|nr:outer membrane beta-barrel protein [Puia sp.]
MRKMVFLFGVSLFCFCATLFAQDSLITKKNGKITPALQAGISLSHFLVSNEKNTGNEPTLRFTGGINMDIPIKDHKILFRPELLLNLNGHKQTDSVFTRTHLSYIKVPANIVFQLCSFSRDAGNWTYLRFGVGPYLAYAIHGNYKQDSSSASRVDFTNKEVPSNTANYAVYFKHWDAGINCFFEFTGTHFYSQLGSSFGLVNIKPGIENFSGPQAMYKNFCVNLSYGWRF